MDKPLQLITNRTDSEIAAEHKEKIIEAARPLMEALTNARRDGFISQLNFGEDAFQHIIIHQFMLLKQF